MLFEIERYGLKDECKGVYIGFVGYSGWVG